MGRYFAIGDIHGMLGKLNALLTLLPLRKEKDTLVFLGDYLDRGPHPRGVIQRLMDLRDEGFRMVTLRGNHEAAFLDLLAGRFNYWDYKEDFNGRSTLASYSVACDVHRGKGAGKARGSGDFIFHEDEEGHLLAIPSAHMQFLENLPLFFETEEFIFVHAGLYPGIPLQRQSAHHMLWIRDPFLSSTASFGKIVVHGHSPVREPEVTPTRINIDTGACFGGKLTCICLPDIKFYQV